MIGISTVETENIRKEAGIEGEFEYGQKNITTLKRNVLNVDEILRIPSTKLLVILRGNMPLLLDKMIYKEHPLSKKLKDSSISEYNPKWIRNTVKTIEKRNKEIEEKNRIKTEMKKNKLDWDNF